MEIFGFTSPNIRFYLSEISTTKIDDSQSSPCLFTVPRFVPKMITYSLKYCPPSNTSSDLCLHQFIDALTLPILRPMTHQFTNVTSLVLEINENFDRNEILPFFAIASFAFAIVHQSIMIGRIVNGCDPRYVR
jgi:hypothetical protein